MTQTWKDFEMVVDIGSEGTYDTTRAYKPTVILDGSTYKMWYTGHGSYDSILYCDSTDGTTWANYQMVVDRGAQGTYDTTNSREPTVILDGSTYKMWYTGNAGSNFRIIYCDSSNGTTWSNHQLVVNAGAQGTYDAQRSQQPTVILDGSTYKMWYTGRGSDSKYRIIYCDSTDGKNWSNHQMVIDYGAQGTYDTSYVNAPTVIKDGSTYKMWYGGDSDTIRIIYCDSTDGKNWANFQMVVDINSEGTYDTGYVDSPTVVLDGSTYKMWYSGVGGGGYRTLYCDYKELVISGHLSDNARIIIMDKSDWSIVANEEKLAGSYGITTTSGEKLVLAVKSDGEVVGYGDVVPA